MERRAFLLGLFPRFLLRVEDCRRPGFKIGPYVVFSSGQDVNDRCVRAEEYSDGTVAATCYLIRDGCYVYNPGMKMIGQRRIALETISGPGHLEYDWERKPKAAKYKAPKTEREGMINVSLFGLHGHCLIIPGKSGITYSNQVAGASCSQRSLEGILVPVDDWNHDGTLDRIESMILDEEELTEDHAGQIDSLLEDSGFHIPARVDRLKLNDSCESWIWLSLDAEAFQLIEGLSLGDGEWSAVLTTENSD